MKQGKRIVAWLLVLSMLISTQGFQIPVFAEQAESSAAETEDMKLEDILDEGFLLATDSNAQPDSGRIDETLPLQPVEDETAQEAEPYIYWNPGNTILTEWEEESGLASDSNAKAQEETAAGRDSADGLLPNRPVKSLSAAIKKAEKLADKLDMEPEDVIIYAMNPMEIKEGEAYFLDGKGMTIMAWDGRDYDSDLIFHVNGGQLSLKDVNLQPAGGFGNEAGTSVIQADAGKVQLGEQVELAGAITLNFQKEKEHMEWATASNADSTHKKTDSQPVVELLKDFDQNGPYYLDVKTDQDLANAELVRTLYADDLTAEEFMDQFLFSSETDVRWEMEVVQEEEGVIRKGNSALLTTATPSDSSNGSSDEGSDSDDIWLEEGGTEIEGLTKKHLIATLAEGQIIYWNPGGAIQVGGTTYPAGNDDHYDGTTPKVPVRTWARALGQGATTVICMQPLTLSSEQDFLDAGYLPYEDGTFVLDGNINLKVTLRAWEEYPRPAVILPEGTTLKLRNLELEGMAAGSGSSGTSMILCEGGQLVMDENITTDKACVQVNLDGENGAEQYPIQVNSEDVQFEVYFGGINNNLNWRFQDVVVPGGSMAPEEDASIEVKRQVGEQLQSQITLSEANSKRIPDGGSSLYAWSLQPDGLLDNNEENPQNLELYTDYYYDAVYLDGVRGEDISLGASCDYPVKTFERAKEILEQEIARSVEARRAAQTEAEREAIALPDKIYICGTVTVDQDSHWELGSYTDENGAPVKVELVAHTGEGKTEGTMIHQVPTTLIHLKGGNLTLGQNILIRNTANKKESSTITVTDGGTLKLQDNAVLTGALKSADGTEGNSTLGVQIAAGLDPSGKLNGWTPGATVELAENWTGSIRKRGVGIQADAEEKGQTKVRMMGGSIEENRSTASTGESTYGAGIVCWGYAELTMTGGIIQKNQSNQGGSGVYLTNHAVFTMEKGQIVENTIIDGQDQGYGAGVFVSGSASFTMGTENSSDEDCVISRNSTHRPVNGAGIASAGQSSVTIYHGTISDNSASGTNSSSGGGIYAGGASLTMTGGVVCRNGRSGRINGGGIYLTKTKAYLENVLIQENNAGGASSKAGGGIYINSSDAEMKNLTITGNTAEDRGGGIYHQSGSAALLDSQVTDNTSGMEGGGIYTEGRFTLFNVDIKENTASGSGGGISGKNILGRNLRIQNNTAKGDGGGISASDNTTLTNVQILKNTAANGGGVAAGETFSLSDDPALLAGERASQVTGNTASGNGGGFYCTGTVVSIALTTESRNTAAQGSNLYINDAGVNLYSGTFVQTENSGEAYNIFVSNSGRKFSLDPVNVDLSGEKPVYLQYAPSYLTFFRAPGEDSNKSLPIDLNTEEFKVGSPVVKPANVTSSSIQYVTQELKETSKTITWDEPYTDASKGYPEHYYEGSSLPSRTQLGGFEDYNDSKLTNLILVGEGVYLSGTGNDKNNKGTSPTDAVRTFEKAKELLIANTKKANQSEEDEDGFSPFIYISGEVPVSSEEIWELDREAAIFTTDSKYKEYEERENGTAEKPQVKRFTSFIKRPMISVTNGGNLIIRELEINGVKEGVDRPAQSSNSPILSVGSGGKAVLEGKANLRNNAYGVVQLNGGTLELTGAENEPNRQIETGDGYGVYASAGKSQMEMKGYSRILGVKENSGSSAGDVKGVHASGTLKLSMTDHSTIQPDEAEGKLDYGVYFASSSQLYMDGNSRIKGGTAGVELTSGSAPIVEMKGSSSICENNKYGIEIQVSGSRITLSDQASIAENTLEGIYVEQGTADQETTNYILLEDKSRIAGNGNGGISIDKDGSAKIDLTGQAAIEKNRDGIKTWNDDGCKGLWLTMKGQSQIRDNEAAGISLSSNNSSNYTKDTCQILLSDESAITKNGTYGVDMTRSGSITLENSARIEGMENTAVFFSNVWKTERYLTIKDQAEIKTYSKTEPAIFVSEADSDDSDDTKTCIDLQNQAKVTAPKLNIQFDEKQGELHLEDEAKLVSADPAFSGLDTLSMQGTLYLDGTAEVDGRIYLKNAANPIVMTAEAPAGASKDRYLLHLVSDFVGQTVVKPDGKGLKDAAGQINYFYKALGDGMAEKKLLLPNQLEKTIILGGENNVYIAGTGVGDDKNSGLTPEAPVRTFKRAKELLEGDGYFTSGANIYVVSTVEVLKGDEDWGFAPEGQVTNTQSGHTWTPVLKPYEKITFDEDDPYMLLLNGKTTASLNVSHLTIDMDEREDIGFLRTSIKCSVSLNQGAIIQNSRLRESEVDLITIMGANSKKKAELILDGAEIRDNQLGDVNTLIGFYSNASFDMKSGKIVNNSIDSNVDHDDQSEIYGSLIDAYSATVQISGGTIAGNRMQSKTPDAVSSVMYIEGGSDVTISGGEIRDNQGGPGAAIYYEDDGGENSLTISGGTIRGNGCVDGQAPVGDHAPIYIDDENFNLKGGGASIEDAIYLAEPSDRITLTAPIYQDTKQYTVYLGPEYHEGHTVVKPDGDFLADARAYLSNFNVICHPYILDRGQADREPIGLERSGLKESQCLILMRAVFLDSQGGDDGASGTSPAQAVKTFERANEIGQSGSSEESKNYYIIYISGQAEAEDGARWTMPEPSYMCRYTGFAVYDENGAAVKEKPYYGYLIEPQGTLDLTDIRIYGRRYIDDNSRNGESILHIPDGTAVTISDGALLSRNQNTGTYMGDDGLAVALTAKGGGVCVEAGGALSVSGGSLTETEAASGAAIYLAAGQAAGEGTQTEKPAGALNLSQSPVIEGDVFLAGTMGDGVISAVVNAEETYQPGSAGTETDPKLSIHLETDWSGKEVVRYPDGFVPGAKEIDYYSLEDHITAVYDFYNSQDEENILQLYMRKILYLDGVNGSDDRTGASPEQALGTLKGVYQKIQADHENSGEETIGALVFVVDGVTMEKDQNVSLSNEITQAADGKKTFKGTYQDGETAIQIGTQVFFKRYSQPEDRTGLIGFEKETYKGSLFTIEGTLNLSGIYVDGHNTDSVGSLPQLQAKAVEAEYPLVTVLEGGILDCAISGENNGADRGIRTETLFRNNTNVWPKNKVIGTDKEGNDVYEGSSAGIELLGGTAVLKGTRFQNLILGDRIASGGSDVYNNGDLTVSDKTYFTGGVFLEGSGDPDHTENSRIINIQKEGTPIVVNFQLHIRDPYNGRPVVHYPVQAVDSYTGFYLLEEKINRYYSLVVRADDDKYLELRIPEAVYIDGQNGVDNAENGRGWVPTMPVKTLEQAYRLLKERSGKVIYVVNTVDIDQDIALTGRNYISGNKLVTLSSSTDRVEIRRFVKPVVNNPFYDVDDFEGVMFRIKNGASLSLNGNPANAPGVESQMILDGHRYKNTDPNEVEALHTDHGAEAKAPMILAEEGGTLILGEGVTLRNNDNQSASETDGLSGGALHIAGTAEIGGTVIQGNAAKKGAGIYQDGELLVRKDPAGLEGQEIYLTTDEANGTDHVIHMDLLLDEARKLDLNMDHAVKGRDVIVYNGYHGVDAQHTRYQLGETVPEDLFLVEAQDADNVLELQNWQILDVEVPEEIFLAIRKDKSGASVWNGASENSELTSPEYRIINHSPYDVKVSLTGFTDASEQAGVNTEIWKPMKLVSTAAEAVGADELYLAVQATSGDGQDGTNGFSNLTETPLSNIADGTVMGILKPKQAGSFQFKAQASEDFLKAYMDSEFPMEGSGDMSELRKEHYRTTEEGTGAQKANYARAMYQMRYRLELDPDRRNTEENGV